MSAMTARHIVVTVAASMVFTACGGKMGSGSDGGSDAMAGGAAGDAGWTACSSPTGYQLCGGPADCNPNCPMCLRVQPAPVSGLCGDPANPSSLNAIAPYSGCTACKDGAVCFIGTRPDGGPGAEQGIIGECVPWEAGELLFRAGDTNIIYADTSAFDGTPLPSPGDCPTIPGLTLCGGACGDTCPDDSVHICIGRSPRHPYSLCGDVSPSDSANASCSRYNPPGDGKHGCLIFHDAPVDQAQADLNGVWIDLPTCQAAAAGYPGGADCVTQ